MDKLFTVAQVIVPIFAAVALGVLARHKKLLTQEENRGLLQFVMQFMPDGGHQSRILRHHDSCAAVPLGFHPVGFPGKKD